MNETPPKWATGEDREALLALFQRAFGASMSIDEWAWKYPERSGLSMVAMRHQRAVAHYGGQPRCMLAMGEPLTGVQISDIMVDPNERGALGRQGLFPRIARAFTEQVTVPEGPHAFVFGFPSPRATRLGELLGLYARMDRLDQASWSLAAGKPAGQALSMSALLPLADALWQQQKTRLADRYLISVRDRQWIEGRYASHPSGAYRAWGLFSRWRRRCKAVAIFREHPDTLELLDLLGEPNNHPPLILALRRLATSLKKTQLMAWATPAVLEGLPPADMISPLLQVNIAGPHCHDQAYHYRQRCWMTAGDTDYR